MTTTTGRGTAIVPGADSAVYLAASGELQLDVRIDSETVWLTQAQLAELFDVQVPTINEHLANIYRHGELEALATIRNFRIVRQEAAVRLGAISSIIRSMQSSPSVTASIPRHLDQKGGLTPARHLRKVARKQGA